MKAEGNLRKMKTQLRDGVAQYTLVLGDDEVNMNELIGSKIKLTFNNVINCVKCGRVTKKPFGQGYCFPCFRDAPENSECVIHPEKCRAHLGEGRDMEWERKHHLQPQLVYLTVTSGKKVGVTRETQIPTRWIDQGASRGILIAKTNNRYEAGVIESTLKKYMSDKTSWQRMLKGQAPGEIDLREEKKAAFEFFPEEMKEFYLKDENEVLEINYPLERHPEKVKSVKFDKSPQIEGTLTGIKGQYLMFDERTVTNIRNQSGYHVTLEVPAV